MTEYISAYETLISHISVGRRAFFDERFQEMCVDPVDLVHLVAFFVEQESGFGALLEVLQN